jgi:pimeloyl-ACP methyl ester carboxylesterase
VKPKHSSEALTVDGAPPILLVGGTNDPATPYAEAQSVNRQIPGSVLLTRQGNGHTSYDSDPCSHAAEDAYLLSLTLPAAGTVCSI